MIEIGAFEAKNKLSALLDKVEGGEEVLITRHGRPIARLVRDTGARDRKGMVDALQRIRLRSKVSGTVSSDWDQMKADRDTGRP